MNRVCIEDCDLPDGSYRIKKGTAIILPVKGLHGDPEIYAEPESFIPERFTKENIDQRKHYTYLPFGEGPRNCIGKSFIF